MNIRHTVMPDEQLTEREWMIRFNVSTQPVKFGYLKDRSEDMMKQWQEGKEDPVFQSFYADYRFKVQN